MRRDLRRGSAQLQPAGWSSTVRQLEAAPQLGLCGVEVYAAPATARCVVQPLQGQARGTGAIARTLQALSLCCQRQGAAGALRRTDVDQPAIQSVLLRFGDRRVYRHWHRWR